jgi:nucleotide-binding universal stress UspA family protein
MIKDIVVNIPNSSSQDVISRFAISVTDLFNSHLCGVAFAHQPQFPAVGYNGIPAEYIDGLWAESRRRASTSIDAFKQATRSAGLVADVQQIEVQLGHAADTFAQIARRFDLSIMIQPEPGHAEATGSIVEAALFGSGRPVLIAPYIQQGGLRLDHVTVCWDGSRTSARAVGDALPFLARAAAIEVVVVGHQEIKSDEMPEMDIGRHLARHGLKIEVNRMKAQGIGVSNVILSHAAETSTSLIVMGGYGHSRMRELILGGTTRDILAEMTIPVLMSH